MIEAEYNSELEHAKDTAYLAFMKCFCNNFGENGPCHNDTALYLKFNRAK